MNPRNPLGRREVPGMSTMVLNDSYKMVVNLPHAVGSVKIISIVILLYESVYSLDVCVMLELLVLPLERVSGFILINLVKHLIFNVVNGHNWHLGISGFIFSGINEPLVICHLISNSLRHIGDCE